MADPGESKPGSDVFWTLVGSGIARCVTLAVALVVVVCAIGAVSMVLGIVLSIAMFMSAGPAVTHGEEADRVFGILLLILYWPLLGLFCSVLGVPLLLFQKWIVGPHFPYLRWGYLAVVAYGPLLLAAWAWPWTDRSFYWIAVIYEVVALAGTVLYARIGRSAGIFDKELAALAKAP